MAGSTSTGRLRVERTTRRFRRWAIVYTHPSPVLDGQIVARHFTRRSAEALAQELETHKWIT